MARRRVTRRSTKTREGEINDEAYGKNTVP